MGDSRECPECYQVNSQGARRCDCGQSLPILRKMTPVDEKPDEQLGCCQECRSVTEIRYVTFEQNIGAIILRQHSTVKGRLCWNCINQRFWSMTGMTLFFGWWGVISFCLTPLVLFNNVTQYFGCRNMRVMASHKVEVAQPKQLVGQTCALCKSRISSKFESRYCQVCESPVHIACIRTEGGQGCSGCGASTGK
jgi:hypothetical protein